MKKFCILLIITISILFICTSLSLAYSTNKFSIYIPYGYQQKSSSSFTDNFGNNININIQYLGDTKGFKYNNEFLNRLESEILQTGKKYFKTLTYDIEEKRITKFGKDNYKCFYFLSKISSNNGKTLYIEQYSVASGNYIYTLTITGNSRNFFDTSEIQSVKNSFVINEFEPIEEDTNLLVRIIQVCISSFIILLIYNLIIHRKKSKQKICYSCGNLISEQDKFCNKCGKELKR